MLSVLLCAQCSVPENISVSVLAFSAAEEIPTSNVFFTAGRSGDPDLVRPSR